MNSKVQRHTRDPLRIRVLRELTGEWKKYAVIFIFLALMIGFISGMYVANNSMLIATDRVKTEQIREDGHFELDKKADKELREGIESGEKYSVKPFYVYEAYKDISTEGLAELTSEEYRAEIEKRTAEADRKAAENYENAAGEFDLDDPFFRKVPVTIFENFHKDTDEDSDGDGKRDSGIREST